MKRLYEFVFEYADAMIKCRSSQKQIAKMILDPAIKLISVTPIDKRGKRK
ncbi:MAG: hypothetical protein LUB59_01100 [Candidatus Gastranaerophilales bacterium]|nr:hypothetical protein [Candidatus Gastranaerophilales bacterium]